MRVVLNTTVNCSSSTHSCALGGVVQVDNTVCLGPKEFSYENVLHERWL
jgi:hypothetical protein